MSAEGLETRAIPIESVLSLQPFVVRRRIAFRDCDPAGIVYTPRFLDPIATSAVELFMAELIGPYGARDPEVQGLDTPAKALAMVFHKPCSYGDLIDLEVFCSRIGETTFEVTVEARSTVGEELFECRITLISVARDPYRSTSLPAHLRRMLATRTRVEAQKERR